MSVQLAPTPSVRKQSTRDRAVAKLAQAAQVTPAEVEVAVSATQANTAAIKKAARLVKLQPKVDAPITAAKVVATVAKVLKKADAEAFEKLSVKLQPNAPASAESKVVKAVIATQAAPGDMIAAFYKRTSGSAALAAGTFGALLQTKAMAGTLKGRQCRHPHVTAQQAMDCAKAMASEAVAA